MFASKQQYRFAVVSIQGSLADQGSAEPVAVVVEGDSDETKTIVIFGRHPPARPAMSDVGQSVLQRLPDLLTEQVKEAVASGHVHDVIGFLSSANRWNVFLTSTESMKSSLPLHAVAGQLFGERVIGKRVRLKPIRTTPTPRREEVFLEELPILTATA